MTDFDKTADELYQLCRRVQAETNTTVAFSIVNYGIGRYVTISIYNGMFEEKEKISETYNITENDHFGAEEAVKAREYLNRLLIEKPCPYCEEENHGE